MIACPFCNGKIEEIDEFGIEEECELCGTKFYILPMERRKNESPK